MTISFKALLAAIVSSVFLFPSRAQLNHIDMDRITQPKVERLLSKCKVSCASDLDSLQPLCSIQSDSSFSFTSKTFEIQASIDEVWNAYKSINPEKAWAGKLVSFGFLYSKLTGKFTYHLDHYEGMEPGQICFINLHFLDGLFNIAVGHEVTEINEEEKYLRLCYLEQGASQGSQFIYFKETQEGYTRVIHNTYYKSDSVFRDKRLYPPFHNMFIKEYHHNMARLIKAGKSENEPTSANHS